MFCCDIISCGNTGGPLLLSIVRTSMMEGGRKHGNT
ncbi:MAG: hypothetical protein PWQ37_2025 [Candidatus Petromonas sp.]|jgi:hypothetical protein|nr:hypothetical protein [Candidatus Petromonas sp.]